jgi:hypothetical protein
VKKYWERWSQGVREALLNELRGGEEETQQVMRLLAFYNANAEI